jgi:hypothetical protein
MAGVGLWDVWVPGKMDGQEQPASNDAKLQFEAAAVLKLQASVHRAKQKLMTRLAAAWLAWGVPECDPRKGQGDTMLKPQRLTAPKVRNQITQQENNNTITFYHILCAFHSVISIGTTSSLESRPQ